VPWLLLVLLLLSDQVEKHYPCFAVVTRDGYRDGLRRRSVAAITLGVFGVLVPTPAAASADPKEAAPVLLGLCRCGRL
jgi:hypothetical protein